MAAKGPAKINPKRQHVQTIINGTVEVWQQGSRWAARHSVTGLFALAAERADCLAALASLLRAESEKSRVTERDREAFLTASLALSVASQNRKAP